MAASITKFFRLSNRIAKFAVNGRFKSPRCTSGVFALADRLQSLSLQGSRPLHHMTCPEMASPLLSNKLPSNQISSKSSPTSTRPRVSFLVPKRNVVTCSRKRGRMMTVRDVPKRFYRLRSGLWIRTICAKRKRHWTRTPGKIWEIRQHLFCNDRQNEMLDKMVSRYYTRPRHWVNNVYEPYEERTGVTEGFKVPKRPFYP